MKNAAVKFTGLFIALAIIIGCLPICVSAAEGYSIRIDGVQITRENTSVNGLSYNETAQKGTFTLNVVNVETDAGTTDDTDTEPNVVTDSESEAETEDEPIISPPTGDAKITLAIILIVASIVVMIVIILIIKKRNVK